MNWTTRSRNSKNGGAEGPQLARMVQACRDGAEEALSGDARDGILNAIQQTVPRHDPLPALFTPTWRLLLTGALPLLLAGVLLLTLDGGIQPPAVGEGVPTVRVSKQDGRVLLQISNGGRTHYVSRSTQPDRFDLSSKVRVEDGAYSERLKDRADLVFYRID